jgi:hypothetical protein
MTDDDFSTSLKSKSTGNLKDELTRRREEALRNAFGKAFVTPTDTPRTSGRKSSLGKRLSVDDAALLATDAVAVTSDSVVAAASNRAQALPEFATDDLVELSVIYNSQQASMHSMDLERGSGEWPVEAVFLTEMVDEPIAVPPTSAPMMAEVLSAGASSQPEFATQDLVQLSSIFNSARKAEVIPGLLNMAPPVAPPSRSTEMQVANSDSSSQLASNIAMSSILFGSGLRAAPPTVPGGIGRPSAPVVGTLSNDELAQVTSLFVPAQLSEVRISAS